MWHGHPNEPKVKSLLRIPAKPYVFLHQRLGFPNKMPYWSCDRLQYFFELDLHQFMKEQVNSYLTLLGINIVTRGWGYIYIYIRHRASVHEVGVWLPGAVYSYRQAYRNPLRNSRSHWKWLLFRGVPKSSFGSVTPFPPPPLPGKEFL